MNLGVEQSAEATPGIEEKPPGGSMKPPPVDLRQVAGNLPQSPASPASGSAVRTTGKKKKTAILTRGFVDDDDRLLDPLDPTNQEEDPDKSPRDPIEAQNTGFFSPRDRRSQAAAADSKARIDAWLKKEGTKTRSNAAVDVDVGPTLKARVRRLVTTGRFNACALSLILLNVMYMGLETDYNTNNDFVWFWVDTTFTFFFASELALRFFADGMDFFRDGFNVFDALLIVFSVFDAVITGVMAAAGGGNGTSSTKFIVALRVARLLRVVRALRLIRFFKELWLIVSGVRQAGRAVLWAWALILLIIYIAGILITRMVGQPYSHDPVIHKYFGDVPKSMFSMFEAITTEGWPTMSRTAMQYLPSVWIFFVLFISITSFGIMNVLTAVIVENTLDMAHKNSQDIAKKQHFEKKKALGRLYQVFKLADRDGNEQLSKEEFLTALKMPDVARALYEVDIDMGDAESLFDILDYDGSGQLDVTEFIQGCMNARGSAKARDVLAAQCDLWRTQTRMAELLKDTSDQWAQHFGSLKDDFAEIRRCLGDTHSLENPSGSKSQVSPAIKKMHKAARRVSLLMPAGFGRS